MLLFVKMLLVCIGAARIMMVSVFLSLDNAFKFACARGCCLFVCVFVENIAVYSLSLSSKSGGGPRYRGCDAGICVNSSW